MSHNHRAFFGKVGRAAAGAIGVVAALWGRAVFAVATGLEDTAKTAGYNTASKMDLTQAIGQLIRPILGLVGVLFLLLMIWGGFVWMTASGNEEKIGKAKQLITGAVIGMVIIFAAYAITSFVVSNVITATSGS